MSDNIERLAENAWIEYNRGRPVVWPKGSFLDAFRAGYAAGLAARDERGERSQAQPGGLQWVCIGTTDRTPWEEIRITYRK